MNHTDLSSSTSDLVELQEYMDGLPSGQLLKLRDMLELAGKNLMFLMEYSNLSDLDIHLNSNTFSWPDRIIPIIRTRLVSLSVISGNRVKIYRHALCQRGMPYSEIYRPYACYSSK